MCLVLESEVILANILSKSKFDHGISRNGLAEYCLEIKEELSQIESMKSQYVYFDITPQSVKKAVEVYQDFFVELGDKIFSYKKINVDYFNTRFQTEISDLLKHAADKYVSRLQDI